MKTKELEQELGLTKHTIRYYEKEGFIKPQKDDNGYRMYSKEDVQILQLVKFLRHLNISIEDVKEIINGELTFEECLRVNEVNLEHQIEELKKAYVQVKAFKEKDLPVIPALENIEKKTNASWFGLKKTTDTVSLGRKLTIEWAKRQLLYGLFVSGGLTIGIVLLIFQFINIQSGIIKLFISLLSWVILYIVIIGMAVRFTSGSMIDNSLDQSVEFLRDGIRYYEFKGLRKNLKYFIGVLIHKEESFMKYYKYEDIEKLQLHTNRKYMKIGTPIAYEVYVVDFEFDFKDGKKFYFYWPMILESDACYIAYIVENKVKNIIDKDNVLYAMKNSINITDYMMNKK